MILSRSLAPSARRFASLCLVLSLGAAAPACLLDAPLSGTDGGTDGASTPDAPRSDTPPADGGDTLGNCFEIFVEGEGTGTPHSNPMDYHILDAVISGAPRVAVVRYYNFCASTDTRFVGLETLPGDGVTIDPSFTPGVDIAPGALVGPEFRLTVRFAPTTLGTHRITTRVHTNHGYYETHFDGLGVSPAGDPDGGVGDGGAGDGGGTDGGIAHSCVTRPAYLGVGGAACGDGPIGPGYPAGAACSTRCAQCAPSHGDGSNCVCDGTRWICPGDTGCGTSGEITYNGGTPPATCP